jgi:hypothetical protein
MQVIFGRLVAFNGFHHDMRVTNAVNAPVDTFRLAVKPGFEADQLVKLVF